MVGSGRKIDEGKNRALQSPLVFLLALAAYYLTCSPLSKRLEQVKVSSKRKKGSPGSCYAGEVCCLLHLNLKSDHYSFLSGIVFSE